MAGPSIIYRHLAIYRAVMTVLYGGKYKLRFQPIINEVQRLPPQSRVLELCFGDIFIAAACKKAGHSWLGQDINAEFVRQAQNLGYNAQYGDLLKASALPKADLCIMMGSFYHFHKHEIEVLAKMLDAAPIILFSEPVSNLSSKKGLLGFIARRAANAGNGEESFRYNRETFLTFLNDASKQLKFSFEEVAHLNRDLIIKIQKYATARG